ncbi:alpha/beta hydrolase [Dactylosporangium aurantiacum]|uniref:Alpha/beta hydrolase n=1 Tax=Dactylosporangium aurantiacum TaxID=35754 RepID=A0A9Q9MF26_9ACTN|nr:alpha/beta hydrolase [Dactylosporangium aurantiacum]MDG6103360.1 alpha/beta hydrolase [Dactylosporangium aurantiacum]UWZ52120.1 alpha/beta hydrolase [Dactylosporangium aurantiacum]
MELTFSDLGAGRAVLLLHGGAGPRSVLPFAARLAARARVLVPTHPGFDGTPLPPATRDAVAADDEHDTPGADGAVGVLARRYLAWLDELGLTGVTVVGNSIGGWIAAEMAVADDRHRIDRLVLVGAVGIAVDDHPVADFFALDLAELAERSYADPAAYRIDPATLTDEQRAVMGGNRRAIAYYSAAHGMQDPGLRARLRAVTAPAVALWGEHDRIVDPDYGRAYAAAIPGGTFELLPGTGHLPQIETPDQLLLVLDRYL